MHQVCQLHCTLLLLCKCPPRFISDATWWWNDGINRNVGQSDQLCLTHTFKIPKQKVKSQMLTRTCSRICQNLKPFGGWKSSSPYKRLIELICGVVRLIPCSMKYSPAPSSIGFDLENLAFKDTYQWAIQVQNFTTMILPLFGSSQMKVHKNVTSEDTFIVLLN